MRLLFFRHQNTFLFWPILSWTQAMCSDPACRESHGWSLDLSCWWWTVSLDGSTLHDA